LLVGCQNKLLTQNPAKSKEKKLFYPLYLNTLACDGAQNYTRDLARFYQRKPVGRKEKGDACSHARRTSVSEIGEGSPLC
jgi:hypothetical protein